MNVLRLPFPPGVNNLYLNVPKVGRVISPRYRAWLAAAASALGDQLLTPVEGSFRVRLFFDRPDRRKRDLDGLVKAPLDFLVKAGAIEDDHLSKSILLVWSDAAPSKPGAVRIELEAA